MTKRGDGKKGGWQYSTVAFYSLVFPPTPTVPVLPLLLSLLPS